MAPFDDSAYEKRAKQLKDDQAKEDREMLRDLPHDYFHSHE